MKPTLLLLFIDAATQAQRGWVTCLRPHSQEVAEWSYQPRQSSFKAWVLHHEKSNLVFTPEGEKGPAGLADFIAKARLTLTCLPQGAETRWGLILMPFLPAALYQWKVREFCKPAFPRSQLPVAAEGVPRRQLCVHKQAGSRWSPCCAGNSRAIACLERQGECRKHTH